MSQHALGAPSSAETWFGCEGSLAMQDGLPDESNEYSDEGTAAHLLGSDCLESGRSPAEYEGETIHVGSLDGFDGAVWFDSAERHDPRWLERRKYTVDDEMIEHIGNYVDRIRQYAAGALLMVPERRVSIEFLTGEKDAHGTSDAAIVQPGELQTHDLKYGMGVRVSAKKNKQLMMYALANREELEIAYGPFERFRFVIHQPRLSDVPDEWDCTAADLDAFAAEVRAKAAAAFFLHKAGARPTDEQWVAEHLHASDDACRWCKAKAAIVDGKVVTCPELERFVIDAAGADFEALTTVVPSEHAEFRVKFKAVGLIEDWCKAIRAKGEAMLFECQNSPEIIAALEIKLVQGKKGNRHWRDEAAAEALLKKMRLPIEERYKMELNSPPAIEKVLKSAPRRWKRVLDAGLIEQRDGQPSVAPADDKRPAWTPPDTSNDFTATIEESIA